MIFMPRSSKATSSEPPSSSKKALYRWLNADKSIFSKLWSIDKEGYLVWGDSLKHFPTTRLKITKRLWRSETGTGVQDLGIQKYAFYCGGEKHYVVSAANIVNGDGAHEAIARGFLRLPTTKTLSKTAAGIHMYYSL